MIQSQDKSWHPRCTHEPELWNSSPGILLSLLRDNFNPQDPHIMVIAGQMWIGSNDSLSLQEDPGALFLTGLQLLIGLKQYF